MLCPGGAPQGPAGTGKTETVKDMARTIGNLTVVSNCSDQIDRAAMGRILKGLVQCGAWGCFDEFNRISLPVLSVVAQQVACVLLACKKHEKQFTFVDGMLVQLNPAVGMFITMNPGYAGRQELPENLKVLFRNVSMMVPDRMIIVRVKLAASGFLESEGLAIKFHSLYKLCEQQLSKQRHYDFGLRNILSVLRSCGAAKRAAAGRPEPEVLMRVLRDMNASKLADCDAPIFSSLIADLFPKMEIASAEYPQIEKAIAARAATVGLVVKPAWHLKLIQLYETVLVRHGIIMMGPSGGGKTVAVSLLQNVLGDLGVSHKLWRMHPKALTPGQMFGNLNHKTNDWTDGVFSSLFRRAVEVEGQHVWIQLDGPVDANWIENLNTVLDDNKLFTLANGDRIAMPGTLKMLFEVEDLNHASPATVSRAGIIYLSDQCLGWQSLVSAWLHGRPEHEAKAIKHMFDTSGESLMSCAMESADAANNNQMARITSMLSLLSALLPEHKSGVDTTKAKMLEGLHIRKLFVFAMLWGLFGMSKDHQRVQCSLEQFPILPLPDPELYLQESPEDSIFECYVTEEGEWAHWSKRVDPILLPTTAEGLRKAFVPSIESSRTHQLISLLTSLGRPVLVFGEPGMGKTAIVKRFVQSKESNEWFWRALDFSSETSALSLQRFLEGLMERRLGSTYGPQGGRSMTVVFDDLSMPQVSEWGDQPTNELTRQILEDKGFYDLDDPGKQKHLLDTHFIGAMSIPGSGRNDIPNRLKRHFSPVLVTAPSHGSMKVIFGTLIMSYFTEERGFDMPVIGAASEMAGLSVELWHHMHTQYLPTPAKFHYQFSLRDLSRITSGLLNAVSSIVFDAQIMYSLWQHECNCEFRDRLVTLGDHALYDRQLSSLVQWRLGVSNGLTARQSGGQYDRFVDFMGVLIAEDDGADVERHYEQCSTSEEIVAVLSQFQKLYNEEIKGPSMQLVFFEGAIDHLARMCRILRRGAGSALCVGVGGYGKRSVVRLAAFIQRQALVQLIVTRAYTVTNLLDDLRDIYKRAGSGEGVVLLVGDNEVRDPVFMDYLNMLLTSGTIANLVPNEDLDMLAAELEAQNHKQNRAIPKDQQGMSLRDQLHENARTNLHIVLCFSPAGNTLRHRAKCFPGIVRGCTIDWYSSWPAEALSAVASSLIAPKLELREDLESSVVSVLQETHILMERMCEKYARIYLKHTYVTPKMYLDFVNQYTKLYQANLIQIEEDITSLKGGLEKLLNASESVRLMKIELAAKEEKLVTAQTECDAQLKEVRAGWQCCSASCAVCVVV